MYTQEEVLNKNMYDMAMMVIPRKFTSGYKKLYPYQNTVPGHIPAFDSFDPNILMETYEWIKNTDYVERIELGLGAMTVANGTMLESDPVTNSYKIQMDGGGNVCAIDGDETFTIPDSGDPQNPDGIWMIVEFTPVASNPNIIFSSNIGNYQMDIAGGLGRRQDDEQYDFPDGNHPVIIPMRAFSPDIGWVPVNHFGVTIKFGEPGDIVELNNVRMYKVQYNPTP